MMVEGRNGRGNLGIDLAGRLSRTLQMSLEESLSLVVGRSSLAS